MLSRRFTLGLVAQSFASTRRSRNPRARVRRVEYERLETRALLTTGGAASSAIQIPWSFEANQGQTDSQVNYLARGNGYTLFLTPTEAVLNLLSSTSSTYSALSMQLVGSNATAQPVGLDPQAGQSNYLVGNDPSQWHTNIANVGQVEYKEVYAGVDLDYHGTQGQLEFDFTVAPGADPSAIRLQFSGADSISIDGQGNLVLSRAGGDVIEQAPVVYQNVAGVQQNVGGHFVLLGNDQVGFAVGAYDPTLPLVIDPVLGYSTYLGGSLGDEATAVAADASGNVYITGETGSTDFPTTPGAFQTQNMGQNTVTDVFVTKLNPQGQLVYSTFIGGNSDDHGTGIAIDGQGFAYITGWTTQSTNYPTTTGAFQPNYNHGMDGFVTKLSQNGSSLVYSTYLGGGSDDEPHGIAVDSQGFAYVVGDTFSTNFPTQNPIQGGVFESEDDGFLTKLNQTGTGLAYSTYIRGSDNDAATGVAVDSANEAIVVGFTNSPDFPITPNAFQTTNNAASTNGSNIFITKFNAAGTGLIYSTFLGGSIGTQTDVSTGGPAVATDSTGAAYVTGDTFDTDFPVSINAAQQTKSYTDQLGLSNAIVAKFDTSGNMIYSTYLGGGGQNTESGGRGIAVDSQGDAYVTGFTTEPDFPIAHAFEPTEPGGFDAFVTVVSADGSQFLDSSYLGGVAYDFGRGIALDGNGNAYVVGVAQSLADAEGGTPDTFPTTPGALKSTPPSAALGDSDGFVTRVNLLDPGPGTFEFSDSGRTIFETTEAAGFVTIQVTRQNGDTGAASVLYATSNGTAKAGMNYTTTSGTLNFAQGQTVATFNVPILDDHVNDGTPFLIFHVTLSSPTNGATVDPQNGTSDVHVYDVETTNTDNDLFDNAIPIAGASATVTGSNVNATTNEGLFGGEPDDIFDFPVIDSKDVANPKNDGGASVWWLWSPTVTGVATIDTSGSNFDTLLSVFSPNNHLVENDDGPGRTDGASLVTFVAQAGETYRICVQGYDSGGGPATGNIVLHVNGPAFGGTLQFAQQSYDTYEKSGSIDIPVTRTAGSHGAISVQVSTSGGTAQPGVDYTAVTQTLNWADGDTSTKELVIPILNSGATGNSPTFNVTLSNATGGADIGFPSSTVVVIFQSQVPSSTLAFGSSTFTANESDGSIAIPVTRTTSSGFLTVSVVASTSGGTAVAGTDYTSVTQTLNWSSGDTSSKFLTIPIIDQGLTSGSKTVNLTLTNTGGGATIGSPSTAVLTILDNDGATSAPGLFTVGPGTFSVNENVGNIAIPVSRKAGATGAVSVRLSTTDGTALAGLDYTAVTQTLNWADGDSSAKTVTIPVLDRGLTSGSKTVNLVLTYATGGAALGNPSTGVLTIQDNDVALAGAIQLSAPTYSVNENGGSVTITATRTGGSAGAVGISYATTAGGTGVAGTDYNTVSNTLSWANGDTAAKTFTIPILDRGLTSGSKTVDISISTPTGGATLGSPSTAVLTILDNDIASAGAIQLSAATYSVNENGGSVTITATRTGGSAGAVGISYATTAGGTGVAGTDYTTVSNTLSWANGDTAAKTFTIPVLDRGLTSGSKTVDISISTPTGGATLGTPSTAVLTIQDNDIASVGAIQLSAATYSVNENGGSVTITATRTGGSAGAVGISYATTAGGTGVAGTDYTTVSNTLSWANGDTAAKTFTIPILDRGLTSGSKTVDISISTPTGGATLGSPSTAVLTILDNDAAPVGAIQFSASTYSVNENGGSVTITATRTGGSAGAVGISYATIAGGTGVAGTDYITVSNTLSWANGDAAAKTFTIPVLDRGLTSGSKTVDISISTPTGGATLGSPSTAVLTILDNDTAAPGTVQFSAPTYSVNENVGSVTITATRTGGSVGAVGVTYATTAGGTAVAGTNYTAVSNTLTWASGDTAPKTFSVSLLTASKGDGDETINLGLGAPTGGATLGSQSTAVLTILDSVPADFLGLGKSAPAVYRPSTAQWYVLGPNNVTQPLTTFGWANLNDIPVPGDYDGVGHTQQAVYRPSTGQWFVLEANGTSKLLATFGWVGHDIPVPGDYDGVGHAEPAVYRPSTGQWFVLEANGTTEALTTFGWTNLRDIPVPGDYDGVGRTEQAVYRPSTGQWFVLEPNGSSKLLTTFGWTNLRDLPAPGDYDGLGHAEPAVYRPSTGQWFVSEPNGTTETIATFGWTNLHDLPVQTSIESLVQLGVVGSGVHASSLTTPDTPSIAPLASTATFPIASSPSTSSEVQAASVSRRPVPSGPLASSVSPLTALRFRNNGKAALVLDRMRPRSLQGENCLA